MAARQEKGARGRGGYPAYSEMELLKKKSTGDPDCPLSVKCAKLLRRAIIERYEADDAEVDKVIQVTG
jgi:hypothetical protein